MSVRDLSKQFIITNCLTGEVITTIDYDMYTYSTILDMIKDLFVSYCLDNEHGIQIKIGYKS